MIDFSDTREEMLLAAALETFSRYGFRRTRMEDIAGAAGLSRAAVYKYFENKDHVFRALSERVHTEALARAEAAFSGGGDFRMRLASAMVARDTLLIAIAHTGPHAEEIAATYGALSSNVTAAFNVRVTNLVARELADALSKDEVTLPAVFPDTGTAAQLLRLSLEGVKSNVTDGAVYAGFARQLIFAIFPDG